MKKKTDRRNFLKNSSLLVGGLVATHATNVLGGYKKLIRRPHGFYGDGYYGDSYYSDGYYGYYAGGYYGDAYYSDAYFGDGYYGYYAGGYYGDAYYGDGYYGDAYYSDGYYGGYYGGGYYAESKKTAAAKGNSRDPRVFSGRSAKKATPQTGGNSNTSGGSDTKPGR
ncbi:MAG: hypothetical protein ACXWPM_03405 [Bdellovibrionota bacterium]